MAETLTRPETTGRPVLSVAPAGGRRPDWGTVLTGLLILYGLTFVVWTGFRHTEHQATVVGDLAFLPVNLIAGGLAWRASRSERGRTRLAWRVLAGAFATFWMGDVLWAYFELVRHVSPSPSWADLFYLSYYPLVLGALLAFPVARRGRGDHIRFALDSTTVLLGGGMIIWYFVIRPTVLQAGSSAFATALSMAYPVGDLVVIFGIAWVLLHRCERRTRRPLTILAAGLVIFVVADTWYGASSLNGTYRSGGYNDALWMIAQVLLAVAAYTQHRMASRARGDEAEEVTTPAKFSVIPYASVAGGYALLMTVAHPTVGTPVGGLLLGAIALTALVVSRQVIVMRENAQLVQALTALASTDELTGLTTRRHFGELAQREFARAARYERPLCAIAIDVDHFKSINDSMGHQAGDEVLREIGRRLRNTFRETDIVARVGGDELIALLPETWPEEAARTAERLHKVGADPVATAKGPVRVTFSIGIADAESSRDLSTLLAHADSALYSAKGAGRDRTMEFGAA